MKLRIRDNSVRVRLTRGEVDDLRDNGVVSARTGFPGSREFQYRVESSPASIIPGAFFSDNVVTVRLPETTVLAWANSGRCPRRMRDGLVLDAADAAIHHSLGLLLVRSNRATAGLEELRAAARLSPNNARFAYVEGIALNSLGQPNEAIEVLEEAHRRFGRDFDIAWALVTMLRDSGDTARAREVAEKLASYRPADPNVAALLESLADSQK